MTKSIIAHISIRLLIAIVPIIVLINKKIGDTTSGNNGIGLDLPFLISLVVLIVWGCFMIFEVGKFFFLKKKKLALIDLFLCFLILSIFTYVAGL